MTHDPHARKHTNQLVFSLNTAGLCECVCVSSFVCLHVEQAESVVEKTTGLIIGLVPRTHANKYFPLPTEEL